MRKKVFGRKLSRDYSSRQALFRSLTGALVEHGVIKTTQAKVKAVQGYVDSLVHLAQDESIPARRRVYASLGNNRETTDKLIVIAKQFNSVTSGFTRMVKLGRRKGDQAEVARLEWARPLEEPKKNGPEKLSKTGNKDQKAEETKVKMSLKDRLPVIGKTKTPAKKKQTKTIKKENKK